MTVRSKWIDHLLLFECDSHEMYAIQWNRYEWNGINVVINPFLDCWFIERKSNFAIINKEKNSQNRNKRLLDARKHKNTSFVYIWSLILFAIAVSVTKTHLRISLTKQLQRTVLSRKTKCQCSMSTEKKRKERKNQSMNQFVKQFYRCANIRQPINMDLLVNEHQK